MKKTLLALSAIALVSASLCNDAMAIEITKGRVLNHKEWTSGNVKTALLKEVSLKELALKFKSFRKFDPYSFNMALSILDPQVAPATVGSPIDLGSRMKAHDLSHPI